MLTIDLEIWDQDPLAEERMKAEKMLPQEVGWCWGGLGLNAGMMY